MKETRCDVLVQAALAVSSSKRSYLATEGISVVNEGRAEMLTVYPIDRTPVLVVGLQCRGH